MDILGQFENMSVVFIDGDGIAKSVPADPENQDWQNIQAWKDAGNAIPAIASPPPALQDYVDAITSMMDAKAKERRYDSGLSISTYVGSANPQWAAEAAAFVSWRDAVWAYCYSELDKVQSGERPQPTVDDFLAELPSLTWPASN
ncbi:MULTISPECIES: hypothetical protein [unclassified Rhizobium]|uniref:hypothetical protein n=1 Tax=unclassified Rhizobium TaxID=2613769 RepID=UPI001ADCF8A3|nr:MULTISPECIES: hypothetical protein [unclassified Rhizobium]MBO9100009.1 hypothetical protein [Rhizobium sp. L58/93]QXZ82820.1 hypothetical protein J5287_12090 [Rhizobium sp. K1/93]QXZ89667.1 hypothetical protein J5280_16500 [Rhizobium sp. K15/93]